MGDLENMLNEKDAKKRINEAKKEEKDKYQTMLSQLKSSDEYKTAVKLLKSGVKPVEIDNLLKAARLGNPINQKEYKLGKTNVRYGVISDTHIGNVNYNAKLMDFAAKEFAKQKVDFVLHIGDIVDGWYQNRPASIFEQNAIGYDQQKELAIKELGKIKQPLYFITGNHEYNTYVRNAGVEIGKELEKGLKDLGNEAHYLGNQEADLRLKNGTLLRLAHPNGGTAYAISYKPQKIIESYEGGKKPHILHIGNFHKAEYLFYRNVHAFQAACMEGQTKFMRDLSLPAHQGFWIIDLATKNGGQVDRITPSFYPAYE